MTSVVVWQTGDPMVTNGNQPLVPAVRLSGGEGSCNTPDSGGEGSCSTPDSGGEGSCNTPDSGGVM